MSDREASLLQQLAERPFDRSLRLVFADWLLERGDERGAVIVAADGEPSLSERRRLAELTQLHAREWLGPLAALADVPQCRFEGGFLDGLVCHATAPVDLMSSLTGDPRLATVRSLSLPARHAWVGLAAFVAHPVLRHLRRVHASADGWAQLTAAPLEGLEVVSLGSWGTFVGELESVRGRKARRLELVTSEFVNPLVAAEVNDAVLSQLTVLQAFDELTLVVRFGVVEGAVAWLLGAHKVSLPTRWQGTAHGVEYGEARYQLMREREGFTRLVVDLEHGGSSLGLGQRIASAATVLVQLAPATLDTVDVRLPKGARTTPAERDALRAAARRLGTVKSFSLGGVALAP
jgi:uncharacterized protein (TIGR02996 family)